MSDHERIWLQNAEDARATGDRLWCQDKVWPECDEQQEPTEYIRADLYASRISQQDAELERVRRELEEANERARKMHRRAQDAERIESTFIGTMKHWCEYLRGRAIHKKDRMLFRWAVQDLTRKASTIRAKAEGENHG